MIEISYAPSFMRQLKHFDSELLDEVLEKVELFKDASSYKVLKVHKLKGRLKGRYSFSVNYKTRIVFNHLNKKDQVVLLAVGDHDVYN